MNRLHLSWLLIGIALLAGCATTPAPATRAKYDVSDFVKPDAPRPLAVSDPIEPVNRGLYRFNYYFDKFLFLPVVNTYEFVMPDYAEQRVSNFFDNIGEFKNLTNGVLQLKPKSSGITVSRFVVNSTIGILGLWDPATKWLDLERQDEDFGQTLGYYGVGNGAYIVLPILGPSNVRDTTGLVADGAAFSAVDPLNFDNNEMEVPYYALNAVDTRHRQPFRYYKSGSPFEYEFVRLLYTEKRKLQIAK